MKYVKGGPTKRNIFHISKDKQETSKARQSSEALLSRVLSGITYAALILVTVFWGPIPLAACMALISWLACSELFRLSRMLGRRPFEFIGLAYAVILVLLPFLPPIGSLFLISSLLIFAGLTYVFRPHASIADLAITVFGPLFTGYLLSASVSIRTLHYQGMEYNPVCAALLTLGVIASVSFADVFAYFIGSRFGKHKMVPLISPNKTWEGFLGSLLGSVVIWLIAFLVGLPGITWWNAIILGVIVALAGMVGDLFESRIKRAAGVKDSGSIMPGHGGMLDRTDSLLFGAMIAYFMLMIVGYVH